MVEAKKKRTVKKRTFEKFQTGRPNGQFRMLYLDMLDSKAWEELTANDIQLYLLMLKKYKRQESKNGIAYGSNKDNISMTEKDHTDEYGNLIKGYLNYMTGRTYRKSLDHLIELGFIKLIKSGYATRECNIYGFNDMWQKYGTKEFDIKSEWFRNGEQENIYKRKINEGCQKAPIIGVKKHLSNG